MKKPFRRREPGTDLVQVPRVVTEQPPPRQKYDYSDVVWRCRCGAMGSSRESGAAHIARSHGRCRADEIREYVPAEVYEDAAETTHSVTASSGIWMVVQMPAYTPEGGIHIERWRPADELGWPITVLDADSGVQAIQRFYEARIEKRDPGERDQEDGRYVAIDFFTGVRAEAEVKAEWRANVNVAEGSHG